MSDRLPEDREDVKSTETWNGGTGTITFNWLQQSEVDTSANDPHPETTDIWGIVDE